MNRYDEMLSAESAQADGEANKYDAIIAKQAAQPNPRIALSYVADRNPDEQANIQRLAELTGIPPDMVSRNRPEVERKAKLAAVDYDALINRSPVTNRFLTDPDNASVAHDDIDALSNVEGAFDEFVKQSGQQHSTDTLDALTRGFGQLGLIGEAGANLLDRSISSIGGFFVRALAPQSALDRNGDDNSNLTGRTNSNVINAVEGYLGMPRDQRVAFAGQVFDQAREGGAGFGAASYDTSRYAVRNPGLIGNALTEAVPSLLAGGVLGGIAAQPAKTFAVSRLTSAFAQQAAEKAIVVGGVNFGAGLAGGAGENLAEGLKKTGDLDQAYAYSLKRTMAEATVNALGGMLPIPFAGKTLGGKLGNLAVEGAAQATGGALGAAAGAAAVGEEASGGEMFLNAALGLATSPVDVAIASASSGRRYWQIQQDLAAVQQLGDMAKNSKLFNRSPQRAEALVSRLKEQAGGKVENILVPAEQFQRYFHDSNLDPEQFATAATGNPDALGEALTLGGDISIPLEKWASVIAKDGHHRGLEQDMRATPDAMTLRELAEFQQRLPEEMGRLRDQVEQGAEAASDRRVFEDVRGQLLGIGREAQTADREASLYQSAFRSLGERAGIDPYDLFNQYQLRVGRDIPEVLRSPASADQLDLMLDRLRSGDIPDDAAVHGPSLIDFIRERGGIRDDGGELAARDVDVGRRGKNRIGRKNGRTLDDMAALAAEAGYFDHAEVATPDLLLRSLDAELRGQRQSSQANLNQELQSIRGSLDDLQRAVDQSGLDISKLSNQQVRAALLGEGAKRYAQDAKILETPTRPARTFTEARTAAKEFQGKALENAATGMTASVSRNSLDKMLSGSAAKKSTTPAEHSLAVANLDELFANAVPGWTKADRAGDPNIVAVHRMFAPMRTEAGVRLVKMTVKELALGADGNRLYSVEALDVEKAGSVPEMVAADIGDEPNLTSTGLTEPLESLVQDIQRLNTRLEQSTESLQQIQSRLSEQFDGLKLNLIGRGSRITISRIEVPADKREAGVGSQVMRELVQWADDTGKQLSLTPSSDFGGSKTRLESFYKRFGFIENKGKNRDFEISESMYRDHKGLRLLQSESGDGARGFIQFGDDRKFNIKLTDKANLSTFLHETGHFYLEVMGDLAARADVSDQVKQDYQTILDWFGVKDRASVKVDQHEQFARGFEAYLREGEAPSLALQSAFSRFKAWLTQIYRDASRLNVQLNDEVRRVFDRLLATDDEIAVAKAPYRSLFSDAKTAGMSPAEFDAYRATADKAGQAAEERLAAEMLRELSREQKKWWQEARDAMAVDVAKEVDSQPVYRVQDYLRKGLQTDGTLAEPVKMARGPLVERYGKPIVSRLKGLTSEDGVHPDLIAEQFGYSSGEEMVQALVGARGRKELIAAETDARMRAQYGDMLNDGSLADRAVEAVHNEGRAKVVQEELRAIERLRRQVDKVRRAQNADASALRSEAYGAIPSIEVVRAVAKQVIADKVVRDIQPHLYLNAERKANRDAFTFASKDRWQEAAEAKQRELLNHFLYREANAARKEEERIYGYMRRFEKSSTRERLGKAGGSYLEQIEALLDQYEFRKVSGQQVARRRSLAQFVSEQEAAGNIVSIPQGLIEQSSRVNYRDLTFEELGGLRDAVVNIEHLARLKNKLLNRRDKRDFEQARADLIAALNDNVPVEARRVATSESSETIGDKAAGMLQGLDASLTRMENVVNRLDGKDTSGPWHALVWNPLAEAQANERQLFNAGIRSIVETFASMDAERLADRFFIPGLGKSFNRREILMHALNTGNDSNRTKLLKGNKIDESALADMLGRLDKKDWDLVQSIWDAFDNLWPEISEMYKRLSGVSPPRIEAKPITTAFGEYRGGYFPIMYDRKRAGAPPAAVSGELFNEGFEGALPSNGFTNQRNESATGPLLLDLSAIPQRLAQHVHDLTHREALQDAHRLTKDPQVRAVLIDKLGPRAADSFLPWLKAIANDRNPPETGNFNQFLDAARTNTSIVGLGLSTTTMLAQVGGLIPGLLYVKPKMLAESILEGLRSPAGTFRMITEASPAMRMRWDTEDGRLSSRMSELIGSSAFFRKRADLVRFSFNLLGFIDRGISGAIWLASYREGLAAGKDQAAAVLDGDKAVRLSQGGTGAMDIAAIQRKDQGAAMRLLTMFYTPFSAYYNQNRDLVFEASQGTRSVASAAGAMLAIAFLQGVVGDLLTGKGPEEDENTLAWMAKSTLGFGVSGFPVIRDTLGAALSGHAGSMSPAWQAINAGRQLGSAVVGLATGDKDAGQVFKSSITAGGYLLGIPTKPVTRQGSYLWNVVFGDEDPESAAEFIKGLLHGGGKR